MALTDLIESSPAAADPQHGVTPARKLGIVVGSALHTALDDLDAALDAQESGSTELAALHAVMLERRVDAFLRDVQALALKHGPAIDALAGELGSEAVGNLLDSAGQEVVDGVAAAGAPAVANNWLARAIAELRQAHADLEGYRAHDARVPWSA